MLPGKAGGPHAAAKHDRVRFDHARIGLDTRDASIADHHARGPRILEQQGAVLSGSASERQGRVQRIHLSVGRHVESAPDAGEVRLRPKRGGFLNGKEMTLDLHARRIVMRAAQLLHPGHRRARDAGFRFPL